MTRIPATTAAMTPNNLRVTLYRQPPRNRNDDDKIHNHNHHNNPSLWCPKIIIVTIVDRDHRRRFTTALLFLPPHARIATTTRRSHLPPRQSPLWRVDTTTWKIMMTMTTTTMIGTTINNIIWPMSRPISITGVI